MTVSAKKDEDSSLSDTDEPIFCSPEELRTKAKMVEADVVPTRSIHQYEKEYKVFCEWRRKTGVNVNYVSDTVVTAYYKDMQEHFVASSLFCKMSKLKKMPFSKEGFSMTSKCWTTCTASSRKSSKNKP